MSFFSTLAVGAPFVPDFGQLSALAPELWLIGTIVATLLTPMVARRANSASALGALLGLGVALVSVIVEGAGGGSREVLRGMFVVDAAGLFWKGLLLLFVMGIVVMWFSTTAKTMREGDGPEFFTLLLGATLGMCLMASTANLLMLVLAVELASLPSYVLAGFRKTSRVGAEASLKYVLFGAATSSIMVYGLSMLYGLYGTLQIDGAAGLAEKIAAGGLSPILVVTLAGLLAGIGFKISAVPFHFWCPDVFEGASTDVSAFLSVASKGAALMLMLRIVLLVGSAGDFEPTTINTALAVALGVLGALTATVGNTAAFTQTNIKRMLAYSSIAHAGYMLCAVSLVFKSAGAEAGFDVATAATQAVLFYLAVYLFMNLGAFTVAGLVQRQTGSEAIADYAGMRRRSPMLAMILAVCLFSLVGLPPFAGFVAKVNVLWALIQNGGGWWWLVGVIGVNTILSLYYYLRIVKVMYLEGGEGAALAPHPVGMALAGACAVMLVAMLVFFGPLGEWTGRHSHWSGIDGEPVAAMAPVTGATAAGEADTPAVAALATAGR